MIRYFKTACMMLWRTRYDREQEYTDANDDDKILDNSVYDVVENEVDDQLDPNVSKYGPTPPRKYVSKY